MNFFKSILSDDSDIPNPDNPHESDPNSAHRSPPVDRQSADVAGGWGFGGLIKTLAIESVIETCRRDLKEFGSCLKKETEILRESASRAVKDFPASLEASASAAQGALEALKSKAEILSKEALGSASDEESLTPSTNPNSNSARYSWYAAQLSAIQSDPATFCEDPEDVEEFRKWKLGFELESKKDEIAGLIGDHMNLVSFYQNFVPSVVDQETFWCRYFYRVDKIKQQESVRANLMKRANPVDDEEELTWDFDDEDEDEDEGNAGDVNVENGDTKSNAAIDNQEVSYMESREVKEEVNVEKTNADKLSRNGNVNVSLQHKEIESEVEDDEKLKSEQISKDNSGDGVNVDVKVEPAKKNEPPAVSDEQPNMAKEDEDLGWDEIEDIGSDDEKKASTTARSRSPDETDLRKRLSIGEDDDEDMNWDIEDDDGPVKKP